MKKLRHPIQKAERYLREARQILDEIAGRDDDYYIDRKYVKMAGRMAWRGVLTALDPVLEIRKGSKRSYCIAFRDYEDAVVSKVEGKIDVLRLLNVYKTLCWSLGYDGITSCDIVQIALEEAQETIGWAEKHYQGDKVDIMSA